MRLPAPLLQRLLSVTTPAAPAELICDRFPLRKRAMLAVLAAGQPLVAPSPCALLDLSAAGVAVGTAQPITIGNAFVLWLMIGGGEEVAIECQAVRVQPRGDGRGSLIVAARFVQNYTGQAMSAAGEDPAVAAIRAAILG